MTTESQDIPILKVLDYLGKDLEPSILIGGWATQFRVGGEISRDIDLIIQDFSMKKKLKESLADYSENSHHANGLKIRGTLEDVHIDAYIPHESSLGNRLRLSVAKLAEFTDSETVKGWHLLTLEAHLVTKFAALLDRPDSEKGFKDAREIAMLLEKQPSTDTVLSILFEASEISLVEIVSAVEDLFKLLPDRAGLNKSARRKLAELKREYLDRAERLVRSRQKES